MAARELSAWAAPEVLARGIAVLRGESNRRTSPLAVAEAMGVTRADLLHAVEVGRQKRPEDDPALHDLAVAYDDLPQHIADKALDALYDVALNGEVKEVYKDGELQAKEIKRDAKAPKQILEAFDERFKKGPSVVVDQRSVNVELSPERRQELFKRLRAGLSQRKALEEERDQLGMIDVTLPSIEDAVPAPPPPKHKYAGG